MATARAIRVAYDQRLAVYELNLSQASVLAYLNQSGPLTQTQLADQLGLGRPATGTVIDALELRGLVQRQPDPGDRRVWMIAATRAGKEMVDAITAVDETLRGELRDGISRQDRQQLAQLLLRLQSNLAEIISRE